jgi:O-antigen/teichoic acid export membrane protein
MKRLTQSKRLLAVVDQLLSSASNFVTAALVAHSVSIEAFGVFAILMSLYWLALGTGRALVGEPLLVSTQRADADDVVRRTGYSAALVLGVGVGLLVAVGGLLAPSYGPAFLALGLGLPVLLLQDALRYGAFSQHDQRSACLLDGIWLLLQIAVGAALLSADVPQLEIWIALWIACAAVSCGYGLLAMRERPAWREPVTWMRQHGGLSGRFLGDFLITSGYQQLLIFLVPLVGGLTVLAAYKAATVVCGPLNTVLTALGVTSLPRMAKEYETGHKSAVMKLALELSVLGAALGAVFAVTSLLLPDVIGRALVGANWEAAQHVVPLVALQFGIVAASRGALYMLRICGTSRQVVAIRVSNAPVIMAAALIGVSLGGAEGLALCLVIAALISLVPWWGVAWRDLARTPAGPHPAAHLPELT